MAVVTITAALLLLAVVLVSGGAGENYVIDFEAGLSEGDIVDSVYTLTTGSPRVLGISKEVNATGGMTGTVWVTGTNPSLSGNNAMIFDATCGGGSAGDCSGGDPDLYAPDQGNVLIISTDGNTSNPNDEADDDTFFEFDFTDFGPKPDGQNTVEVYSLTMIDIEPGANQYPVVTLYTTSGTSVTTVTGGGDGVVVTKTLDTQNVTGMKVEMDGSGAIDSIRIRPEEGGVTAVTLSSFSLPSRTSDPKALFIGVALLLATGGLVWIRRQAG